MCVWTRRFYLCACVCGQGDVCVCGQGVDKGILFFLFYVVEIFADFIFVCGQGDFIFSFYVVKIFAFKIIFIFFLWPSVSVILPRFGGKGFLTPCQASCSAKCGERLREIDVFNLFLFLLRPCPLIFILFQNEKKERERNRLKVNEHMVKQNI